MNRVVLIGRLTRDPELRYVSNGQPVASFTLAVGRSFRTSQGERRADFIDVVAWRKSAELVGAHLSKGRLVAVAGRLQVRTYETPDGQKRKAVEVVASQVQFLDRKTSGDTGDSQPSPAEDENDSEARESSA